MFQTSIRERGPSALSVIGVGESSTIIITNQPSAPARRRCWRRLPQLLLVQHIALPPHSPAPGSMLISSCGPVSRRAISCWARSESARLPSPGSPRAAICRGRYQPSVECPARRFRVLLRVGRRRAGARRPAPAQAPVARRHRAGHAEARRQRGERRRAAQAAKRAVVRLPAGAPAMMPNLTPEPTLFQKLRTYLFLRKWRKTAIGRALAEHTQKFLYTESSVWRAAPSAQPQTCGRGRPHSAASRRPDGRCSGGAAFFPAPGPD